jgi:DNA-binding NarL/FixJ family response regulator
LAAVYNNSLKSKSGSEGMRGAELQHRPPAGPSSVLGLGAGGGTVLDESADPSVAVESQPGQVALNIITALVVGIHRLAAEAIGVALGQQGFIPQLALTTREAVLAAKTTRPDLALIDLGGSNAESTLVGLHILAESPKTKIIVVTNLGQPDEVAQVRRAGFHGWVTKQTPLVNLSAALASALQGQYAAPHSAADAGVQHSGPEKYAGRVAKQLTTREWEVLKLLARGFSNRNIGLRLSISPNTVRAHVQGILAKFEVHSRLEAVTFAARNGLVDMQESEEASTPDFRAS